MPCRQSNIMLTQKWQFVNVVSFGFRPNVELCDLILSFYPQISILDGSANRTVVVRLQLSRRTPRILLTYCNYPVCIQSLSSIQMFNSPAIISSPGSNINEVTSNYAQQFLCYGESASSFMAMDKNRLKSRSMFCTPRMPV